MSEPFEIAIDLERSFAELSLGFITQSIVLLDGRKALDSYFWAYGKVAHRVVEKAGYLTIGRSSRQPNEGDFEPRDYGIYVASLVTYCDYLRSVVTSSIATGAMRNGNTDFVLKGLKRWERLTSVQKLTIFSTYWEGFASRVIAAISASKVVLGTSIEKSDELAFFMEQVVAVTMLHTLNLMVSVHERGDILAYGRLATVLERQSTGLYSRDENFVTGAASSKITESSIKKRNSKAGTDGRYKKNKTLRQEVDDFWVSNRDRINRTHSSDYAQHAYDEIMSAGDIKLKDDEGKPFFKERTIKEWIAKKEKEFK
jgi:hypothetical protein